MEIADTIEEIKTICSQCKRKATINAKYSKKADGVKIVHKTGNGNIEIGAEEKYEAMCWKCWNDYSVDEQ